MSHIHPTAVIADGVILGEAVTLGPYVVVEAGVQLGDHCVIEAQSVIKSGVRMGRHNHVHAHVVLGDAPQDLTFNPDTPSWLDIGDGNVFREGFIAHRASQPEACTLIGDGCYFMNHSHVAHDCVIGNQVIFANNVALGGHVTVGDRAFLGGAVVVHQFCRIGAFAMVQGTTGLNKDVLPFSMIGGRPARHYRLNRVGLNRAGVSGEAYRTLELAFRRLRQKKSLDDMPETEQLAVLRAWLAATSKRGIHEFAVMA
ncbi:MAG: acyl-ACP--UDP-N-acetylglucosamine O-acyltransferase [Methylococcales bacterium]|nr:acyl-ACP--UDP-N-acetylglucosamine O-acyltransferase [Methylococcales bacterium]